MVKERPKKRCSYAEIEAKVYAAETILPLSPQEALIIDQSLKGNIISDVDYRWLLLSLGQSIVGDINIGLAVTGEDLWFLRAWIDPNIRIGGALTGQDVVNKIYVLLLELWEQRFKKERFTEMLHEAKIPKVREVQDGDTNKDNPEDDTEDNAET